MTDTSKEALHLLNERMCGKINDGGTVFSNDVADMLDAIKALAAENDRLKARVAESEKALKVFAECADELDYETEATGREYPDDEWAKFRLLVSDYRLARAALKNKDASDD